MSAIHSTTEIIECARRCYKGNPRWVACAGNAIASDYLRKMGTAERAELRAHLLACEPDLAMHIATNYPHHWQ